MILEPPLSAGLPERELAVKLALSTALAIVAWVNLEFLGARCVESDVRNAIAITAAGASVGLVSSGSVVLGFLGAALTAAMVAGELAGSLRGGNRLLVGTVSGAAAILIALVLEGHIYASLPGASALLLAAGPGAAWIGQIGPLKRFGRWPSVVVAILLALIAVGMAVAMSSGSEY